MNIIEISERGSGFDVGIVNTVVDGVSDQFQRLSYSEEQLLVSVQNLLKMHEAEIEDSKSLIGRIVGRFSKPIDADNIIIDGMRLAKCFEITGDRSSIPIHAGKIYQVDRVSLSAMINRVEAILVHKR